MTAPLATIDFENVEKRAALLGRRRTAFFSPWLVKAYLFRPCRPAVRFMIDRFEGGAMYSQSLRTILSKYYEVEVGLYTYGACLKPGVLPPGTSVGRYCSLADDINFFRRNHPKDWLSTHPFFFNHHLGIFSRDTIGGVETNPLRIGHDVWIGHSATILPGCHRIGDGSIIGACAVVTKDVPAFGVVVGNPGKLIGYRFAPEAAASVARSGWWLKPIDRLNIPIEFFTRTVTPEIAERLLQQASPSKETP